MLALAKASAKVYVWLATPLTQSDSGFLLTTVRRSIACCHSLSRLPLRRFRSRVAYRWAKGKSRLQYLSNRICSRGRNM